MTSSDNTDTTANEMRNRLHLESLLESIPARGRTSLSARNQFMAAAALPNTTNNQEGEEQKDVEFAILESQVRFDWSKAGMILLDCFHARPHRYLLRTVNFTGDIPQFCDSEHFRCDEDYYRIHQDEEDEGEEEDDDVGAQIPFSAQHFDRWIHQLQDELLDAEWRRRPSQTTTTTTTTAHPQQAALGLCNMWKDYACGPAKVIAFETNHGDRMEYWTDVRLTENEAPGYAPTGDHGYIILQTGGGRLLILGVTQGHPILLCNLLQFDNSDGSTRDLHDTISFEDADGASLVNRVIALAKEFLFDQEH